MTSADLATRVKAFELSLRENAKPERAEFEKNYLKSSLRFIGANAPAIHQECRAFYRENKGIDKKSLDLLCSSLWQTDCHELRSIAIGVMERFRTKLGPNDLPRLRRMVIESAGWAHVDTIAVHVVGAIYEAHPEIKNKLRQWSTNKDFWVRRASMLALLNSAKRGDRSAFDLFTEFAVSMLTEKEFFIRKAIGWVLREVSKKQPEWVVEFFDRHAAQASGLTFREGSKYLPEKDRLRLRSMR